MARITPSQRQIHPLFEEKAQLVAYDNDNVCDKSCPKKSGPTPSLKRNVDDSTTATTKKSHPAFPLRAPSSSSFRSSASRGPCSTYHPAPNICVEGGKIEFIKSPSEGSNLASLNPPTRGCFDRGAKQGKTKQPSRNGFPAKLIETTGTRTQETQSDTKNFEFSEEKCDVAKEFLEAQIKELHRLLESEQRSLQRERLTITRLQRQLARRDAIQRDVDRERRLRTDTESRLRDTVSESERYKTTLASLQREFSKMEDSVRTMLQYKSRCELLNQEKVFLTAAYENRIHQFQNTVTKLGQENETLKQQVRLFEEATGTEELPDALLDRLRSLETENAHLSRDADSQRKQYERCLDDIANQVVRALLSQKGLREEIGNLQRRIKELENQNQALANILVNKGSAEFVRPPMDKKSQDLISNESSWFPGTFSANKASLSADATASAAMESHRVSSLVSSSAVRYERKNRLRRLYFSDLGDTKEGKLFRSLNSVDSLVILPLQRPKSLNLQVPTSPKSLSAASPVVGRQCQQRKVSLSQKPAKDEGNESPESGNRDEGYSTMSSDIQGPGETSELSKRELEDLKEASDETDVILDTTGDLTSIAVVEDSTESDMFFIPLNLSLSINPRHSYPCFRDFFPFQHAMRSLSDSHLCLKLTAARSSFPPPRSPSVFFFDLIEKNYSLSRAKATSSFPLKKDEGRDIKNIGSWCSGAVEGCWWDCEYVQHWLKLDDHRSKENQQKQKKILPLEYDQTEIEEWTMSLSCEDVTKTGEMVTTSTLSSVKENFHENAQEWKNFSPRNLTRENRQVGKESNWSYETSEEIDRKLGWQETAKEGSWSSCSTNQSSDESCQSLNDSYSNDCHAEIEPKYCASSCDAAEVSSTVGTDFTRDFYRLVKFESTKSLASNSSRSNGQCDLNSFKPKRSDFANDREMALQSVLSFIVEQQKYCHNREEDDDFQSYVVPHSDPIDRETRSDRSKPYFSCDENECIDEVVRHKELDTANKLGNHPSKVNDSYSAVCDSNRKKVEIKINLSRSAQDSGSTSPSSTSRSVNAKNTNESDKGNNHGAFEKESSTKLPVRNYKTKNSMIVPISRCEKVLKIEDLKKDLEKEKKAKPRSVYLCNNQMNKSSRETKMARYNGCEKTKTSYHMLQQSSSELSKESINGYRKISKSRNPSKSIPGKLQKTRIPISIPDKSESISRTKSDDTCLRLPRPKDNPRVKGTKIPIISTRKSESALARQSRSSNSGFLLNARISEKKSDANGVPSMANCSPAIADNLTTRHLFADDESFHQKATTKDVIDELNRMIRKGEDISPNNGEGDLRALDVACCCPTGWVHVERDVDFTDPKARANLLDVMLASSGSSETNDDSSESEGDEPVDYTHLHRLHRFRRQRKASATREQLGVLRYSLSFAARPTIIGRENLFVRYGDKEKEAVASFDFLERISTTSISGCSSCDSLGSTHDSCLKSALTSPTDQELPLSEIRTPPTPTTPVTPSDDSDEKIGGAVSFSDSCADSYAESAASAEEICHQNLRQI